MVGLINERAYGAWGTWVAWRVRKLCGAIGARRALGGWERGEPESLKSGSLRSKGSLDSEGSLGTEGSLGSKGSVVSLSVSLRSEGWRARRPWRVRGARVAWGVVGSLWKEVSLGSEGSLRSPRPLWSEGDWRARDQGELGANFT